MDEKQSRIPKLKRNPDGREPNFTSRLGMVWLILALACQFLLGADEVFLHTLYAGAVFTLGRLIQLCWNGAWPSAVRVVGTAVACLIAAGLYLFAFVMLCLMVKEGKYPPPEPTKTRRQIPPLRKWGTS